MCVWLFICSFIHLCMYVFVCLLIDLSIYPFIKLSLYQFIYLSSLSDFTISLSLCRSIHPSIHPSVHPSIRPSVDLSCPFNTAASGLIGGRISGDHRSNLRRFASNDLRSVAQWPRPEARTPQGARGCKPAVKHHQVTQGLTIWIWGVV